MIIKPTVGKPRSLLQQLQSKVNWAIHFKLHDISVHNLTGLHMTNETAKLIKEREMITKKLKKSIRSDYLNQRANILNSRRINKIAAKAEKAKQIKEWDDMLSKIG